MPARLLITGSNRGTGYAIASTFHDYGYAVASLNRTIAGEAWLGETPCDLTDPASLAAGCSAVLRRLGGIEVCVLNAAIRRVARVEQMAEDDWDASVATNLSAVFRLVRRLIPGLRASRGHLIIMGSHAGSHPFEGGAAYCATKAALKAFTEVLILETRPDGIRTTLINAGAIRNRPLWNDDRKIQPETIARLVFGIVQAGPDALVGEVEVRPSNPLPAPAVGIERLQYV